MKKGLIVGVLLCLVFITYGCNRTMCITKDIRVEVISVNTNIMEGVLIGQLLGSSSGNFTNNKMVIGIKIIIDGEVFLKDLQVYFSELAYYKDSSTIPINITYDKYTNSKHIYIHSIIFNHRKVYF